MKKLLFFVILFLGINYISAQNRYKIEYDLVLTFQVHNQNAGAGILFYDISFFNGNTKLGNYYKEAASFSGIGQTSRKIEDKVVNLSLPVTNLGYYGGYESGASFFSCNGFDIANPKMFAINNSCNIRIPIAIFNNSCVTPSGLGGLFKIENLIDLNPNISPRNICEEQNLKIFDGCNSTSYSLEAKVDGSPSIQLLAYEPHPETYTFDPLSFAGITPNSLVEFKVYYNANKSESNTIVYDFIACSPTLLPDETATTNETCFDSNNGSVTLTFDHNVDVANGYQMRYFIYQGDPADFNNTDKDNPFPPQAYDELLGVALTDNGNGTFSGSSDSNLENGNYYILYQEVLYNGLDVTVKSGEITPQFTISRPSQVSIADVDLQQPACTGDLGKITLTGMGGGFPPNENIALEYGIQGEPTSWQALNVFDLAPGDYTFLARSSETCIGSPTQQITINTPTVFEINSNTGIPQQPSTPTSNDGKLYAQVTGGTADFTFELYLASNPTAILQTATETNRFFEFTNLGEGTYFVLVKDMNSCEVTSADFTLQAAPLPVLGTPTISQLTCFNDTNGEIAIPVSGGTPPYSYRWAKDGTAFSSGTSPDPTITVTNLGAGDYELRVASAGIDMDANPNAIASSGIIDLNNPQEVVLSDAAPNNISCFGAQDGSIAITATGGTSYEYTMELFPQPTDWILLDNNTVPIPNGGFYRITLRNQNGCESSTVSNILVEEPDVLSVSEASKTDVTTNGGNDGTLTITVIGGTTAYSYVWTRNGSSYTPSVNSTDTDLMDLTAGTYQVTVTDANNCTTTLQNAIVISEPGALGITVLNGTDASCNGSATGSITAVVTGIPPFTYTWQLQEDPGFTAPNLPTITNLVAGTYTLRLTDASNLPEVTETVTLSEPANAMNVTATPSQASCFGGNDGSIQITATNGTPPYEYAIDDGFGFQAADTFTNLLAGSYTATVRDASNCEFIVPTPIIVVQPQEIGLTIDEQGSLSAANATDGIIRITAFGGTGNLTYNWIGPDNYTATTDDINNLAGGTYTLTITDVNYNDATDVGCTFAQDFIIAEPGQLIATIDQTVLLECNGDDFGELMANVQGGVAPYTLEWFQTENSNNTSLNEDTEILADLSVGTYFVRVTDANSISIDAVPFEITQPAILEVTVESTTNVLCSGEETGAIDVSVNGGTPPYQYFWNNGATTENLANIPAGEYTLEVVDVNNCLAQQTVTVDPAPDALRIIEATVSNISEFEANDGSIVLDIAGGATPYSITWVRLSDNSNAGEQVTISNLPADSYEVSISDANGCTVTETYEVTQPDIVEETIVRPTCTGDSNGSITVVVNQGNGSFSYNWSNGATTNSIENILAGSYTVTITGFGNGPLTRTYEIEDPLPLVVDLGENRTLCADQELLLDATVEDETATYSWTSDNGFTSSGPNVALTETGNYNLIVSTASGCSASGTVFVDISADEINAEFAISTQVFVGERVLAIDISYPLPETLEWVFPEEATIVEQNSDEAELVFDRAGEYEIGIVTTRGDCTAQKTKKIIVVAKDGTVLDEDTQNGKKQIEDFIIYPNPTNGKFTADVNLTERGNISIKIFSLANNAMIASEKERGKTSYSIPFDLSGLPTGVYAVLLETPYGDTLRKIIIK